MKRRNSMLLMKGMAINITVVLMIVLVMLVIMFLITGVFKDFIFRQQSLFGLVPGTETVEITDDETSKIVTIECNITSSEDPPDEYEYKISLDRVGFEYTSTAKVFPVFAFRSMVASSVPEEVELPNRLSFSSLPIKYNLSGVSRKKMEEFEKNQSEERKETVVIGFFKKDEKCLQLAKETVNLDQFVDKCAKKLETATSVVATRKACV